MEKADFAIKSTYKTAMPNCL